jgi:hypothetical protein
LAISRACPAVTGPLGALDEADGDSAFLGPVHPVSTATNITTTGAITVRVRMGFLAVGLST